MTVNTRSSTNSKNQITPTGDSNSKKFQYNANNTDDNM